MPRSLSASTIARLKQAWADGYQEWNRRRVDNDTRADGIYSDLRAEQARLWALVIFGVN